MKTCETLALGVAASKTKLKKRLLSGRSVLVKEYRDRFKKYSFDFQNRRLVSEDGKLCLQWELRACPDEPESYLNQQTNSGNVILKLTDTINEVT